MQRIVLNLKDDSKLEFLQALIKNLSFVDIVKSSSSNPKDQKQDIFQSAGIWKNRAVESEYLRKQAWKRSA